MAKRRFKFRDHFKNINDTYGHDMGDYVLQAVASTLRHNLRSSDVLCGWGGEELIILLPSDKGIDGVATAEKLRRTVAKQQHSYGGHAVSVTMSFGVSEWRDHMDFDEMHQGCRSSALQVQGAGAGSGYL